MNRTFSTFRKRREEKHGPTGQRPTEPQNRLERRPEQADPRPAGTAPTTSAVESTVVPSDDTTPADTTPADAGLTKPIVVPAADDPPADAADADIDIDSNLDDTDDEPADIDDTDVEPAAIEPADADTIEDDAADVGTESVDATAQPVIDAPETPATSTPVEITPVEITETETKAPAVENVDPPEAGPDAGADVDVPEPTPAATTDFREAETTRFAAVTPTPPVAPSPVVPPAGSPADDNATERIDTASEAATERINIGKSAPAPTPPSPPAPPAGNWKAEPSAPQYIPAGGGNPQARPPVAAPKKSRKALWVSLVALIAIIAAVVVVVVLAAGSSDDSVPAADVAAERALEYTTALEDGNIAVLREITCGETQQRLAAMSDEEFAEDHRVQQANNELVGVDEVKASKIVEDGNSAVVEVIAYKTATPDEKLDVALTLSKIDGEWKVCKA